MGNCLNCVENPRHQTPVSAPAPKVEEVIGSLKAVSDTTDHEKFVRIMKQQLEKKKSDKGSTSEDAKEKEGMWTSFVTSGATFLGFVNGHTERIEDKEDIFYSGNSKVVADILGQIGQLHWAVGGLAITAYLIEKFDKVYDNKVEALQLLSNMVDLVTTVIKLGDVIHEEEEKLKNAVMLVVQGSIMCISQIHSGKFFRFLKASVNSGNLREMSNRLDHLYRDLTLAISTASAKCQSEMAKRQSVLLPVRKPFYPTDAVGIEDAQEEVIQLLNMTTEDESTMVVVLYGFGGIGKTTLANAVLAALNLDGYNYARVHLDEDKSKNDLKKMQKQILKDAFPSFHSRVSIELRDCQEGRDRLKEAFLCAGNKPVFLFLDNALRSEELQQLLPEDLSELPKRSRIFLTTRMLNQTDVFLPLARRSFAMKTLKKEDAEKILCKDPENRELIKDDMERILRICGGVPLALRIVRGHLYKMEYNAGKCSRILDALEKGVHVKEENLSQRLIEFVYNEFDDSTKDAFLDICWYFTEGIKGHGGIRRHVEYVVGAQEVKLLEEAALLTPCVEFESTLHSGEERLQVHDLVRAKGRAMSASTRFTDVEYFCEAAQDETKLNAIKGLQLRNDKEYVVDVQHLNSMRHSLRYLHGVRTSGQSPMKFKQLKYLFIPWKTPHLPMKVEELNMLRCMVGPTKGMSVKQLPKRLSFLSTNDLNMESSSTQDIQNHSLEDLILWGRVMKRVPEGLHQLSSLKFLTLFGFVEMEEFPEQVCKLSSLTKLVLASWDRLKCLPQSFGRLKGLNYLVISDCNELEDLPSSFGELKALEFLRLTSCGKLKQELPGGLESLKYLHVEGCEQLSVESYHTEVRSTQRLKMVMGHLNSI